MNYDQLDSGRHYVRPRAGRRFWVAFACAVLTCLSWGSAHAAETQKITLDAGWNLITFQVLPDDPSPQAVFGALGADFGSAWTYDNATKEWTRFAPGAQDAQDKSIARMADIQLGRAYWVYMSNGRGALNQWQVTGSIPTDTPALNFTTGWNLVGFPTGTTALSEPVNILSVLAVAGLDYDTILRWEISQYAKFTPDTNDQDDFTVFLPDRGYWVNVKGSSFKLQPKLLSSVRADIDVEPQGNYPSYEDLKLSNSPTPLGPSEQTDIVFRSGEDSQQLAIANTGGGILLWELQWPQDKPWLVLSSTKGVTTIENDVVNLYLDSKSIPPGQEVSGPLVLKTTAGSRSFNVRARASGVGGTWKGNAEIASVDGKANAVPTVDLAVSFFEDPNSSGLIRGFIDSTNALLWPVDVPLIGHISSNSGNRFTLSGAYILPPGDVNNPPYERFAAADSQRSDPNDIDWNNNGKLDNLNPFPFPIYRSVTITGSLRSSVPSSAGTSLPPGTKVGYTMEGAYEEVIYGMLNRPITLKGSFSLSRQSSQPFTNRRIAALVNDPAGAASTEAITQPVVYKTDRPAAPLPLSTTGTRTIQVNTEMVLEDVSVELQLANVTSASPGKLTLTLQAPDGTTRVVLFDKQNIDPSTLQRINFPVNRPPKGMAPQFDGSFASFVSRVSSTKGSWTLLIQDGGSGASLISWSLRLQGQPVFDVRGKVVDANGNPLTAEIFLNGLGVSGGTVSGTDGTFVIPRLPGIPLNLTATQLGFGGAAVGLGSQFLTPSLTADSGYSQESRWLNKFRPLPAVPVAQVGVAGFSSYGTSAQPFVLSLNPLTPSSGIQVAAAPLSGPGPLEVSFRALGAISASANVQWSFNDGTPVQSGTGLFTVTHTFTAPGSYVVSMTSPQGTATATVTATPAPKTAPAGLYFFQANFTAGGALPGGFSVAQPQTAFTTPQPADLMLVQHAYTSSADIDLEPKTKKDKTPEVPYAFGSDGIGAATVVADSWSGKDTAGNPASVTFTTKLGDNSKNESAFIPGVSGSFRNEDHSYTVEQSVQQGADYGKWDLAGPAGVTIAKDSYRTPPWPNTGQIALHTVVCNIGPSILPPPNSVVYAKSPTVFANESVNSENDGIARSRLQMLVTGPLAPLWKSK